MSGRSAAWLARLPWEQEVGGSNPLAPTSKIKGLCLYGITLFLFQLIFAHLFGLLDNKKTDPQEANRASALLV